MIRIVFTRSNDAISWSIRKATRSRTSHVGIVTEAGTVISAEWPRVVEQPITAFMRGRTEVAIFEPWPNTEKVLDVGAARACIGQKYDLDGVVGAGVSKALRWLGIKIRNPFADGREVFCSELVLALDPKRQVADWKGLDPERTSPHDLAMRMAKGYCFHRVR